MKFTVAAIFSAVASAVYAQTSVVAGPANAGVAVNEPSLGLVVTNGTLDITWTIIPDITPASSTINSIALMSGDSAVLSTSIANILSGPIPVSPSNYMWNIPSTVVTMPSYVLALTGSNGATTYSNYFTIIGAAPGTVTTTSAVVSPAASGQQAIAVTSAQTSASSSASASNAATSHTSSASSLKAGLTGSTAVIGAIALLL